MFTETVSKSRGFKIAISTAPGVSRIGDRECPEEARVVLERKNKSRANITTLPALAPSLYGSKTNGQNRSLLTRINHDFLHFPGIPILSDGRRRLLSGGLVIALLHHRILQEG